MNGRIRDVRRSAQGRQEAIGPQDAVIGSQRNISKIWFEDGKIAMRKQSSTATQLERP